MTLVVINAVGLTPRALEHMPRLSRLGEDGFRARLDTILPAVTCSVQSTFVTGTPIVHLFLPFLAGPAVGLGLFAMDGARASAGRVGGRGMAVAGLGWWLTRGGRTWNAAIARLDAEPGITVIGSERSGGKWHVKGLRDPLARNPAVLLASRGVDSPCRFEEAVGSWQAD